VLREPADEVDAAALPPRCRFVLWEELCEVLQPLQRNNLDLRWNGEDLRPPVGRSGVESPFRDIVP